LKSHKSVRVFLLSIIFLPGCISWQSLYRQLHFTYEKMIFVPSCDGITQTFHKVFQATEPDLKTNFTALARANTEILQDCSAVDYFEYPNEDYTKLTNYGITKYEVEYSCKDIDIQFDTTIYRKEESFYIPTFEMAACGDENIRFENTAQNNIETWFNTDYLFEYLIIDSNLRDPSFCKDLKKQLYGIEGIHCD
jgi:hypothetical protein